MRSPLSLSIKPLPSFLLPHAIVIAAFALLGVITYLSWPLASDPSVHFTGIHQGVVTGKDLGELWTFRGPVYNGYLWGLYRVTTWFVPFQNATSFSLLVRSLHLVVMSGVCTVWAISFSRFSRRFSGQALIVLGLALLGCTSMYRSVSLHAEDVSHLLLLTALACALSRSLFWRFIAGALAGLLPLVKGLTALFCFPAALAVLLPSHQRGRGVGAWIGGFLLSISLQLAWLYQYDFLPVRDLFESAVFQSSTLATHQERWTSFQIHWLSYSGKHPLTVVAAASGAFLMTWQILRRRFLQLLLGASLWLTALGALILQDRYFTYHLGLIAPATIVSLSALTELYGEKFSRREAWILLGATSLTTLFFLWQLDHPYALDFPFVRIAWLAPSAAFVILAWGYLKQSRRTLKRLIPLVSVLFWAGFALAWTLDKGTFVTQGHATSLQRSLHREEEALRYFEKKHGLKKKTVLLLSYGHMSRYLQVRSACRHFFPIPVQRLRYELEETFAEQQGFQENRDCILSYEGDFILLERKWLAHSSFKSDLKSKLKSYHKVDSVRINRERTLDLYVKKPPKQKKKKKAKETESQTVTL